MPKYRWKNKKSKKRKSFPIWLVVFGTILLIAFLWVQNSSSKELAAIEVIGAPAIRVSEETIDYGNVKLGEVVRPSIKVTNVGEQTLKFEEPPYIEVLEGC